MQLHKRFKNPYNCSSGGLLFWNWGTTDDGMVWSLVETGSSLPLLKLLHVGAQVTGGHHVHLHFNAVLGYLWMKWVWQHARHQKQQINVNCWPFKVYIKVECLMSMHHKVNEVSGYAWWQCRGLWSETRGVLPGWWCPASRGWCWGTWLPCPQPDATDLKLQCGDHRRFKDCDSNFYTAVKQHSRWILWREHTHCDLSASVPGEILDNWTRHIACAQQQHPLHPSLL